MNQKDLVSALERELVHMLIKYPEMSGQDLLTAARTVADGYFDDHDPLYTLDEAMAELTGADDSEDEQEIIRQIDLLLSEGGKPYAKNVK